MNKKDIMARLLKHEGAVVGSKNIHADVIDTPSPSLNFIFGNGQGLPRGYTALLYGVPKSGKSIIANSMAARLHQTNPESWVVKYNTEYREGGQLTDSQARVWGIDKDRYVAYETNTPDGIFDHIETEIAALCQNGVDIGLVIIDSLTGIQGRRAMNADTVMTQQIGDNALTIQDGLKRILPIQRKYNFALVLTVQARAEMDTYEVMRGNKVKPAASFGAKHHCEYFVYVEANNTKEGRTDLMGAEFKDETLEDLKGNAEKTGHKVRVKMMDSSLGPKGRVGEFTFDYHKGIINVHEELFLLGVNRNIIAKPNNVTYSYNGMDYRGKEAILTAIKEDVQLRNKILSELKEKDMAHMFNEEASP